MNPYSFSHVADHVLPRDLAASFARERGETGVGLAILAEFDARKLYLPAAHPTMHQYLVVELGMSDDTANKRIRAARVGMKFPAIFPMVANRRLTLSAVLVLAVHLTRENAEELLAAAARSSRSSLERLLAERFPRQDTPTVLRTIPSPMTRNTSHLERPGPTAPPLALEIAVDARAHSLAPGPVVPSVASLSAHTAVPLPPRPRISPLSPGRYELRTTLDQATHDKLRRVQELLSHAIPSGDIAAVLGRALELAIETLEKRRLAATSRPGAKRRSKSARHIPADVRRAVHERDGDQCTFVSASGRRCAERRFLEIDHVHPVARGGQATLENTRLRCRAHNQYAAECTFGAGFMREKRQAAKARAEAVHIRKAMAS